jgi:hypothetical protein
MERAHRPLELELGPTLFPPCLTSRLRRAARGDPCAKVERRGSSRCRRNRLDARLFAQRHVVIGIRITLARSMSASHALPALRRTRRGSSEMDGGVVVIARTRFTAQEQDVDDGVSDPEEQAETDDSRGDGEEQSYAGPVHVPGSQADGGGIRFEPAGRVAHVHEHVGSRRVHVKGRVERIELVDKVLGDGGRSDGE